MEDNLNNMKLPYLPPVLELFEYEVEHGFAQTSFQANQMDTWSQINDRGTYNSATGKYDDNLYKQDYDAGQNYHGEWY